MMSSRRNGTPQDTGKPSIFVASSRESLPIAKAIQSQLNNDANMQIWDNGFTKPGDVLLNRLLAAPNQFDFGIFVFGPDDVATVRKNTVPIARDNVLFELGIFMGRLGVNGTFVVRNVDKEPVKLPNDLDGLIHLTYSNQSPAKAVKEACECIREKIKEKYRHQGWLPASVLDKINEMTRDLTSTLGSSTYLDVPPRHRLALLYQLAHRHAQRIAEEAWPSQGVHVCLKRLVPGQKKATSLVCEYLTDRLDRRLRGAMGPIFTTIPIAKTIPGWAWVTGEPQFVEDISKHERKLDPRYYKAAVTCSIGSIIAWPVFFQNRVAAVVTADFERKNAFDGGRRSEFVMGALAANFELVLKLGSLVSPQFEAVWSDELNGTAGTNEEIGEVCIKQSRSIQRRKDSRKVKS